MNTLPTDLPPGLEMSVTGADPDWLGLPGLVASPPPPHPPDTFV